MTRTTLTLAALCFAGLARAHDAGVDEPETADLEGLLQQSVVTGPSRAVERADDAPATVTMVSSSQLRTLGLRSLHEAINFLSSGMVAQDPLHSVEVGARGVLLSADYGNHMLVTIDGHTLNEAWNSTAYFEQGLALPLELVDHFELIVGPGSVLYGSSAMLGVINVVTRRARDVGLVNALAEGTFLPGQSLDGLNFAATPGGSGRFSLAGGLETQLGGHPLELVGALESYLHQGQTLTYARQNGLTDTDGTTEWPRRTSATGEPGTWGGETRFWGTRVESGFLRARLGEFTLWGRLGQYTRQSPAIDQINAAGDFGARGLEVDRFANVELSWAHALNPNVSLKLRAYFDGYEYLGAMQSSSWATYGSGSGPPEGTDLQNFTFLQEIRAGAKWGGLEAQATIDWLGDARFPLLIGVDGRLRSFSDVTVDATTDGTLFATANAYEVFEWQCAAYVQQRARLFPTLQLNVGARLDAQSAFTANVSPRAALVWTTPWNGKLKGVFSTAFRTPSGYERFAEYEGFQVRNPNLKPERVLTGELGYEQRVGRQRIALTGFVSRFNGLISTSEVDSQISYQNLGGLLNAGAQATLEGAAGPLGYGLNFTAASNSIDGNGQPLPASPTWFGNARVTWTFGSDGPRASVLSHFSAPRLITTAFEQGADADGNPLTWAAKDQWSPAQVELRAVLQGDVKQVPGLWLRGVVSSQLTPFSPYVVGPATAPSVDNPTPALSPNTRLLFMLTIGWSLDGRTP